MKQLFFYSLIALLVATSLFFSACSSSGDGESGSGEKPMSVISGVAQKGQFLRGSSITIYALDKMLNASGLSYPTQTTNDLGAFSVSNVNADFIDVKANGYYYNENKGETSQSTINLQAVTETKNNVNVNLLTTLAYNRIKHLVSKGLTFSEAQDRAQIEVLTALGLGNSNSTNFTEMNIAGSGDANGLLLAASLLIQQDRSVGDVSKLISDIAADIEEDGILSSELSQEIHENESYINVSDVINGLVKFYEKNKVENFNIPTFYKFLDTDGDGKMDGTAEYIFKNINYSEIWYEDPWDMNRGHDANGFSCTLNILSTIPFNVESDASWLSVEKKIVAENIYVVNVVAQRNTGENRTANVIFTNNSGKELAKYSYQQKAPDALIPQRIFFGYNSELNHFVKDKMGVNGKTYDVSTSNRDYLYGYYRFIDIPNGDKQERYQVYFPTNMISMPDGYGTYRLTIPETITSDDFPFITQREDNDYNPMTNPTSIRFLQACPAIVLDLVVDETDYVVLTAEVPLAGSAIYNIQNGEVDMTNPQIENQSIKANNGLYTLTVKINHQDTGYHRYYIPVLLLDAYVTAQYYNKDGQIGITQYARSRNYHISF